MYDVLVVGAGPGGATCARYLARAGFSVALIDRDEFPRDKPCGGGFSRSLISEFPYLKHRQEDFLEAVCRVGVLHSPNRRIAMSSKIDMAVTLRTKFDNVLFESAVEEDATPITGRRVRQVSIDIDGVAVTLADGSTLEGRVIVGADGVGSIVARQAALHRKWPSTAITACRVVEIPLFTDEIVRRYTEDLEYHFYANLGGQPGYGWIFPKRTTVNVGLGVVGKHAAGLPRRFRQFVRLLIHKGLLPPRPDISRARGALVPTGGTVSKTYADRVLLVGDSAGMVNPITGGGIHYAMLAARYAARVLGQALEQDDLSETSLAKYQHLWMTKFGNDIPNMLKAQRLFTSSLTDVLFEIGSRDLQIQQMVSDAMAEHGSGNTSVTRLALRTVQVILREAFT